MKQVVSSDDEDVVESDEQHTKPCADCPWARKAVNGWLGSLTSEQWLREAFGEARIDCHTIIGPQCAGAAIFRANICKKPRDRSLLLLPPDNKLVFSNPMEFTEHHSKKFKP